MATITIKTPKLEPGTVVDAFKHGEAWPFIRLGQIPPIVPTETQTVASDQTATFTTLVAGQFYALHGTSEGREIFANLGLPDV